MASNDPSPLKISRVFPARRSVVFRAWTSAEYVSQWFSPAGFTVPHARVEPRVGGVFEVCMRAPDGQEHWSRGVFREVTPETRLVFDMSVPGPDGGVLFTALTEVDFSDAPEGARVDIVQSYTIVDPIAAGMIGGASEGWRTTLDKLEATVRASGQASVAHATFRIERVYDAPLARVWTALTDPAAKRKWFAGPPGEWTEVERHMDVRVGGSERAKGRFRSGRTSCFDAIYLDVVAQARLVYVYTMHLDDRKMSATLATMELQETAAGTRLVVTEQGAFLDGYDDAGSREKGTEFLLDQLETSLGV